MNKTIEYYKYFNNKTHKYTIELNINQIVGKDIGYLHIPSGAIYGADKNGMFVCLTYKMHGWKNGCPMLKIHRPSNYRKWYAEIECNETTKAILEFKKENPKIAKIYWGDDVKNASRSINRNKPDIFSGEVCYCGCKPFTAQKTPSTSLYYVVNESRTLDDIAREQRGKKYL